MVYCSQIKIPSINWLNEKSGCVEKDKNEKCWLTAEIEKTEQEPTPHTILIPKSIYALILELEQLTQPLRFEAEENNYILA